MSLKEIRTEPPEVTISAADVIKSIEKAKSWAVLFALNDADYRARMLGIGHAAAAIAVMLEELDILESKGNFDRVAFMHECGYEVTA